MNMGTRPSAIGAIAFVALAGSYAQAGLREGLETVKVQQYERGFTQVQQAAEAGSPLAQRYMGHYYSLGWGREKDWSKAVTWYARAANGDDSEAPARLAVYYFNGSLGAERDCAKARNLAKKAAERDWGDAYVLLASSYENGVCDTPNFKEAISWFEKAAGKGYAGAAQVLGVYYWQGRGVKQDFNEAHKWFLQAADQGNAVAMYQLALMYLGDGRKLDVVQAMTWIELAQKTGVKDEYTSQRLERLRQQWGVQLNPEQRQEVNQRVARFQPQPLLPELIEREWQKDLGAASQWDAQQRDSAKPE